MFVMSISTIMRTHLVTISPETALIQALDMLEIYQVSCIPVVSDDKLIGIISSRSIQMKLSTASSKDHSEINIADETVALYLLEVRSVLESDTFTRAIELVSTQGLDLCPVVNSEGGLVGMVSFAALLTAICENR